MTGTFSTEGWVDVNSTSFYTRTWRPSSNQASKATILFVHGFMEHVSRTGYLNWFNKLSDSGYTITAYDQRGFGRTAAKTNSQGKTSYAQALQDLEAFVAREVARKPQKLFLFAHSMGGALLLLYATNGSSYKGLESVNGIVVSAPLIDQAAGAKAPSLQVTLGGLAAKLLPTFCIPVGVPSDDICRDPQVNKDYAEDPLCPPTGSLRGISDMLTMGPKLASQGYETYPKALPLLMYHGTADKVTSFEATKEFYDKVQADDKTFLAYEGYYHELQNEPGDDKWRVLADVTQWLDKRV